MHARNADAMAIRYHQISQIVGTGKKRLACRLRGEIFGVVGTDGNCINNRIIVCNICRVVRRKYGDPHSTQLRGLGVLGAIRATNAIAERERDLRQRRHTDAADSNKENAVAIP